MARTKANKLLVAIPTEYRAEFFNCLDAATPVGQAMHQRCALVLSDLGGEDGLSAIKRSTARDWSGLDVLVETLLCRLSAGKRVDVGALTQLINTKVGLARMLGLERRAKRVRSLPEVMRGSAA